MPKITVQPGNIQQPSANTTVIDNPVLRNLLVHDQAGAMEWLNTRVAPVNVGQVSIDDHGRVVVADAAFAKVISDRIAPHAAAAGDTACSNGSC